MSSNSEILRRLKMDLSLLEQSAAGEPTGTPCISAVSMLDGLVTKLEHGGAIPVALVKEGRAAVSLLRKITGGHAVSRLSQAHKELEELHEASRKDTEVALEGQAKAEKRLEERRRISTALEAENDELQGRVSELELQKNLLETDNEELRGLAEKTVQTLEASHAQARADLEAVITVLRNELSRTRVAAVAEMARDMAHNMDCPFCRSSSSLDGEEGKQVHEDFCALGKLQDGDL